MWRCSFAMFSVLAVVLASCATTSDGFARVPVKGRVEVDGAPLAQGVIRLLPAEGVGGRNVEAVVRDGEYVFDDSTGPVAGPHRVEIEATGHLGFELDDEAAYTQRIQTSGSLPPNPIPPKFNRQSQLATEIPQEGKEDLNFSLATR